MSYGTKIDLAAFKKTLVSKNPAKRQLYYDIFQSFAKRIEYCKIYYSYFENATTEDKIKIDYHPIAQLEANDFTDYRLLYESATLSFLQNLHALCDTLSFAVNEIALDKYKITGNVYLNDKLVDHVKLEYPSDDRLYNPLKALVNDTDFLKLKAYVNLAKHAHIVKILNYGKKLALDEFPYFDGTNKVISPKVDLSEFMQDIHRDIAGKVMKIYIVMQEMITEKP